MLTRYAHIRLAPNYLKNSDANKVHRFSNTFTRFQKLWKQPFFSKGTVPYPEEKSTFIYDMCNNHFYEFCFYKDPKL